jgi:gluconolactonase
MKTHSTIITTCIFLIVCLGGCSEKTGENANSINEPETMGFIEKTDDELDRVLNADAVPEVIGQGYEWSEGPVWVEEHQFLLFSDVPANTIYKWTEEEGVTPYLKPSGYTGSSERGGEVGSNGLIIGNDGELLLCQHGDRRIARMDASLTQPASAYTSLADNYRGMKFNSPNDLVQHSSGSIYFTDPPYGLEGYVDDPLREMDYQGVYRIDPDGDVTLLTDELSRPNGLAFSPDESLLYVANSDPQKAIWMVYDVTDNGGITNGRVFHDATGYVGEEPGLPDGMKVNTDGYLFATGPGGIWIFAPDARVLGKIKTGEFISNCAFDEDETTLYMTVDSYVLRLAL